MILTKTNNNYTHELFGSLTTNINENNEVFFIGKEVAEKLGYSDTAYAIKTHCKGVEEMSLSTNGGVQKMKIISELDLFRLVSKTNKISESKKEEFINWIKSYGLLKEITLTSRLEIEFFELLELALIPFNLNLEKQFSCLKYKIDGYIKDLNIAIEYDEVFHLSNKELDNIREFDIIKELGCRFIRVSSRDTDGYNIGLVLKSIFNIN